MAHSPSFPKPLRKIISKTYAAFAPPPTLTVSQWADRERYLSPEAAAEPGRWDTNRAEYLRGIMDAVNDPTVSRIVVVKGSQVGYTECLGNIVGFYVDQDPASILVVQPTLEMAEAWSKDRLSPMIRDTPVLAGKVSSPLTRDSGNTLRQKVFPSGRLTIVGANSPAGLASRPIRIVLADEIDRYPVSAGTEGDPLALASKRQGTFWNRKTLVGSTPTLKDTSVIWREWEASDMRRYYVPCHACGHAQPLEWRNVRWDKGEGGAHLPQTAHYACAECGSIWNDPDRWDAVQKGKWIADHPEFTGVAGFHVPGLLSPWVTLESVVREFLTAKADPSLLQVWSNTVLGECFEPAQEALEGSSLSRRGENYTHLSIPDGVRLLTAGIDTQSDRLELQILGFGALEECWAIRYEIIHGDPAQKTVWDMLDQLLLESYRTDAGRELRIRAACIDSGGHHANAVLSFCRIRRGRVVLPIKGISGPRPIWPKRASKTKTRDTVFMIGVDTAKDTIYGRLRIQKPGSGYIHFPVGGAFDQVYFEQLTSEVVQTRHKEGRPYRVWVLPPGKRNEALDTFGYALAARSAIPVRLDRLPQHLAAVRPICHAVPASGPTPMPQQDPRMPLQSAPPNRAPARRARLVIRSNYMMRD
jgi:phage terminase large subunit GpA-like protein